MIYFIVPEYMDEIGDCCIFKDSEGERIINKRINSALNGICLDRCLDFRAIKNRSKKILNQRNLAPLYISESEILIPVKVRKPRVTRDGGYGYLNVNAIKEIKDKHLLLNNGEKIIFKDSSRTIIKRIKMARILKERVNQRDITTDLEITGKEYEVMKGIEEILKQVNLIKTTMEGKRNI